MMKTTKLSKNIIVRSAIPTDLQQVKSLADLEKRSFGFITRKTLEVAIENGQIKVVEFNGNVIAFQHYYHRKRDLQTTLYHKVVDPKYRRVGFGTLLVNSIVDESKRLNREFLLLKCPADLPSNAFHQNFGFELVRIEEGKTRKLNVWMYTLNKSEKKNE